MIELTPAFKTAIANGEPMKYQYLISEDNGVSWQSLPDGAEVVLPLGSLSGETETEPFKFVGPDIEISANNENGYWSNTAKTGKLDTGTAVKMQIKTAPQSITNEWVRLINGFIDLATVENYRHEYKVVFIVRGQLNILDATLANFAIANRSGTYPHKFGGWLKIVSVDPAHPEGLFELRFDASEQKISWDNGVGQSIDTTDNIELVGQQYNHIVVKNLGVSHEATALPQTSGTISQWIAVKVDGANKKAFQPNTCMTLADLKKEISGYIDLNLDGVASIPIKCPDANIVNHNCGFVNPQFTRMQPVHVVGLDDKRWLISLDGGVYTGNFIIPVNETPHFEIGSWLRFDPSNLGANAIIVNSWKSEAYLYLLVEETATRQHSYSNTIRTYNVYKYNLAGTTFVKKYTQPSTRAIYYKSVAWLTAETCIVLFHQVAPEDITKAILYKMIMNDDGTATFPSLRGDISTVSSMCPGAKVMGGYVVTSCYHNTTNNTIQVYYIVYSEYHNYTYVILSDIEYPGNTLSCQQSGSVQLKSQNIVRRNGKTYWQALEFYLLAGPVVFKAGKQTDNARTVDPLSSDKMELYRTELADFNSLFIDLRSEAQDFPGYTSSNQKKIVYTDYITYKVHTHAVGESGNERIHWLTGNNTANDSYINNQEIVGTVENPLTKFTIAGETANNIMAGDTFRLHSDHHTTASAEYGKPLLKKVNISKKTNFIQSNPLSGSGIMANTESAYDFDPETKNKLLYKNVPGGYPIAGDYTTDGKKILIATQDNLQFIRLNLDPAVSAPNQMPEVALADFDDKTLRAACEGIAKSANCYLMPSEHNGKLSLIYKGATPDLKFTILNTEYQQGSKYIPYYNYDLVKVNSKVAGIISAGDKQRSIDITTQTTPEAYSQSLALDIFNKIPSGDRLHDITVDGRLELEPGDFGYLEIEDGTQKKIMLMAPDTEPETLKREMLAVEI